MVQTTVSFVPRRAAGSATAAVLLGAGLACAGNAHASTGPAVTDPVDMAAVAIPTAIDIAALPAPIELPAPATPLAVAASTTMGGGDAVPVEPAVIDTVAEAPARVVPVSKATVARHQPPEDPLAAAMSMATRDPDAQVAVARNDMAKWKPVAQARLDTSRGGFDAGGLQIGFGIDRAVFVNGALAVSTSITIPDVSQITAAQAAQLARALGQVTVAVGAANNAAKAAVAAAQGAAAAAQGAAGQAGQAASSMANGAASSAQGAAGMASTAVGNAAGTVTTNGLLTVIQNGAGNIASVGSLANTPGTVIQNNLNNQNIQSLMTLNASVNTLAAFRTQMANTALNSVIQRSAAMK